MFAQANSQDPASQQSKINLSRKPGLGTEDPWGQRPSAWLIRLPPGGVAKSSDGFSLLSVIAGMAFVRHR